MTNSPNSGYNKSLGVGINIEWIEFYTRLMTRYPTVNFCELVARTEDLAPADMIDYISLALRKHIAGAGKLIEFRQFMPNSPAIIVFDHLIAFVTYKNDWSEENFSTDLKIYSDDKKALRAVTQELRELLKGHIVDDKNNVTWYYKGGNGSMEDAEFPIKKYDEIMPEVYPFINKGDVNAWVKEYLASKSNILILNGPMGTGKSSLIAHIIRTGECKSMTAFDLRVMQDDALYTNFIGSEFDLMVLEDADRILFERLDGDNDTMSKLLNVSEGIIDTSSKKIIFTANLGNIEQIDPALRRPGRCFDVVEFRALTKDEANVARRKLGRSEYTKNDEYTLAQIYQK